MIWRVCWPSELFYFFDLGSRADYHGPMATDTGDVVLVNINSQPAFFARVETIEPDVKPEWWQVSLLVLQVPVKTVTWILRPGYIEGDEFTMGGTPVTIEKVKAAAQKVNPLEKLMGDLSSGDEDSGLVTERAPKQASPARVISLTDRLKK